MANNSGLSWLLLGALCLSLLTGCGAGGVSEPPNNTPHINGDWNVDLGSASNITFGLRITQTGAVVDGTIISYTGTTPGSENSCLVFTGLTAHGNVDNNMVTLAVSDPQSSSTITISGTVSTSTPTAIGGTFATTFGSANGNPACANLNGSATLSKQ